MGLERPSIPSANARSRILTTFPYCSKGKEEGGTLCIGNPGRCSAWRKQRQSGLTAPASPSLDTPKSVENYEGNCGVEHISFYVRPCHFFTIFATISVARPFPYLALPVRSKTPNASGGGDKLFMHIRWDRAGTAPQRWAALETRQTDDHSKRYGTLGK